jgi:cell division protein FtsQ
MSALTRDPRLVPPLTAKPATAPRWDWPDPDEVTPPPMARAPGRYLSDPRWPVSPPPGSWPPLPDGMAPPQDHPLPPEPPSALAFDREPAVPVTLLRPPPPPLPAAEPEPAALHDTLSAGAARQHDPSPSRAAYRMNRLWLTPAFRHFVRLGLPVLLVALVAGGWLSRPDNRAALSAWVAGIVDTVQNQPMFLVHRMEVQSRSPEVAQGVAAALQVSFPVSSFDLDLPALRAMAEDFEAIEQAWLQVRPGGVLEVRLQERLPAMVWRHAGGLDLIDATGHRVAQLASREARADLPLIAGEGAPEAVAEALLLWAAATPLQSRIRGLVRMGERRWDLVLDRNQRILLPEDGALGALERVLALDATQGLLSRDLSIVDLRIPSRPVLRLSAEALADLHRNRSSLQGAVTQ